MQMLQSSPEHGWADKPGGVFLRRSDLMPPEDQTLLKATARAVMDASQGGLNQQLVRPLPPIPALPARLAPVSQPRGDDRASAPDPGPLASFNGLGGFVGRGEEYAIKVHPAAGAIAPAPWVNIVAHPTFGFAATDLGLGFTWSENSHDNRLTPWRNDPVSDPPGEAIFLRDDENGRVWSATPLPAGGGRPYTVRHSQGYSIFEHSRDGISSAVRLFVPRDERAEGLRDCAAQHLAARAPPFRDAVCRMDPGRTPRADAPARRHEPRAGDRCRARHQRLPRSVRRSRGVPRPARRVRRGRPHGAARADNHRRSQRVHRPERHAAVAGRTGTAAPVRPCRAGARSLRRRAAGHHAGTGRRANADRSAGRGGRWGRGTRQRAAVS